MRKPRKSRNEEKTKRFVNWLRQRYWDWQRDTGELDNISQFAKYIDDRIGQPNMSKWLNGKTLPAGENVHLLAAKLGPEIYDILEVEPPVKDPRLRAINVVWDLLSETVKNQFAQTAERAKARRDGQKKGASKQRVGNSE